MSSVQIFVDVFGSDGLPHTFIKVTHPDGSVEEFGLVPKTGGSLIGAGNIDITGPATDHGSHEFTLSMTPRELTNDQYANLMQFINRKKGTHLILTFTRSLMFCAIH